jgi:hypothetical protein
MRRLLLVLIVLAAATAPAAAKPKAKRSAKSCLDALDKLGVAWKPGAKKIGVEIPVEIDGPIGGLTFKTWSKSKGLYVDCSLAYSLAKSAAFFTDAGVSELFYSGTYERRNVRGTNRPSKHSYALAIDVHQFAGDGFKYTVEDDYEQGLGDDEDCIGKPLTSGGRTLRTLFCRLTRSELYKHILTPDYDADHYNHFHIEARPWSERTDLGDELSAEAAKTVQRGATTKTGDPARSGRGSRGSRRSSSSR